MKKIVSYLKYPLMVALVYYLIASGRLDFAAFGNFLNSGGVLVFVGSMLLLFTGHLLFTKRYQIFTGVMGFPTRFRNVFKIIMIGVFYNNFLPGGTGGDLMRIYYINRKEGVPVVTGTALTVLDRIVGLLGLTIVAGVSLFFVTHFADNGETNIFKEQKLILLASLLAPVVIVACLLLLKIKIFNSFLEKLFSRLFFGKQLVQFMGTFTQLINATPALLKSLGLCIIGHIITISVISLLAYTLYGVDALMATYAVAGIVLLTTAVPVTPGNIGMTEWLADTFYKLFGVEGGATVFALWRLVFLFFSLSGGVIYLTEGGKKKLSVVPRPE